MTHTETRPTETGYGNDARRTTVFGASGVNMIAGVWLILAPWILDYSGIDNAVWNDVLVGIAVVILAGIRLWRPVGTSAASWLNVLLGGWLIIAPWVLDYAGDGSFGNADNAQWNDVVLGIVIGVLAIASGLAARAGTSGTTRRSTRAY